MSGEETSGVGVSGAASGSGATGSQLIGETGSGTTGSGAIGSGATAEATGSGTAGAVAGNSSITGNSNDTSEPGDGGSAYDASMHASVDAGAAETGAPKVGPPLPTSWIPVSGYQSTENVPHGKVQLISYNNPVLNATRKANVYTPPGYDSSKQYPVLYALHGIGGTENEWLQYNSRVNEILDNLLAASKMVPMVVVFPNGRAMNPDSVPSDLYGSANTQAFHDFWPKDMKDYLIPFIQKTFSVYTDKAHRAVLGYSMGGGQALEMGLPNPDYFEFIGAMAPAYRPDVSTLDASQVNANFEEIFLSAGTNDQVVGYTPILDFHNSLTSKGISHVWVSVQGGAHDGTTWCPGMYNFSQIIFK